MTAHLRIGEGDPARVVTLAVRHRIDVLVLEEVTPRSLARLAAAGAGEVFPHRAGSAAAGPGGTVVLSRARISGVRRLDTRFGSYAMDVGRMHLLAVHPFPPVDGARQGRADQEVVRRAASGLAAPAMVVGDLNATMDHVPWWQRTWPASGEVTRLGLPVPTLLAVDHVLVTGLSPVRTETFELGGTDHRPLAAALYPGSP